MDGRQFDSLARLVSGTGTRRSLARLLLGVPLLGGLTALVGPVPDVAATTHDRRGVKRHRHQRHKRQPTSTPSPPTPPCPVCQARNNAGQCVPDVSLNRSPCAGSGTATSVCCNGACCHGCCGADGSCGACRVFVTSTVEKGNLKGSSTSGLAGADAFCQQLASTATPPLPGTYRPWLSDSTASPSTRFRCTQASCSAQGYVLVDGTTVVATDWTDLTTCAAGNGPCLAHAIDHTEQNAVVGAPAKAWTHTNPDGTAGGTVNGHCLDWSTNPTIPGPPGDYGNATASDATWTGGGSADCFENFHLYCFQQS